MKSKRPKQTDMKSIRHIAMLFANLPPQRNEEVALVTMHPFTQTDVVYSDDGERLEFSFKPDDEAFQKFANTIVGNIIIPAKSFFDIMMHITEPFKMEFMRYCEPYLSETDFSGELARWWVNTENPNSSYLVENGTVTKWFKSIKNKGLLMSEEELKFYNSLPSKVTLYRGVAVGRKAHDGLSWTPNKETATWFANRFNRGDKRGYLLMVTVPRTDCLAYFNSRDEDEIVADCRHRKISRVDL